MRSLIMDLKSQTNSLNNQVRSKTKLKLHIQI